jgi:hypothetical protein
MTAPLPQPCEQWRLKLAATHPADLKPAERAALEAHLATCASCAAVYAAYARLDAALQRVPVPALEGLPPKLLALWAAEDHQRANEAAPVPLARRETPMRPIQTDTEPTPIFPQRPAPRRSRRLVSGLTALAAVLVIALLAAALLASRLHGPNSGPTATPGGASPTPVITASGTASVPPGAISIQVYFPKLSDPTLENVFPVQRFAPSATDIEAFSIQLLIAGPTPTERSQGYFSELNSLFSGPSLGCSPSNPTIGGPDFTLTLNMKGTTPEQGTATVKFCRPTSSPGIGADARVTAEITKTLEQFPDIKKVVILTQSGQCFGDESGANLCLR